MMHARIKSGANVLTVNIKDNIDLNRVAEVERRIFKNGELKAYELHFRPTNDPYGVGTTVTVPAEFVEVL